jgi:type IV pilus assembly protein PilA
MKKMNNKGFSLIELIIVIAIMAILVAIIAPNLTKYLGKSKKNTDKKNADEIASQIQTSISDYESQDEAGAILATGSLKMTWSGNTVTITGGTTSAPSGGQSLKDIVESNITSSTTSKEDKSKTTTATVTCETGGKYKIEVTVGNATVTK